LSNLPSGESFAAGNVVKAGLVFCEQFPGGMGGDFGVNRATKFVSEQAQSFSCLPGIADLFVEAAITGRGDSAVQ